MAAGKLTTQQQWCTGYEPGGKAAVAPIHHRARERLLPGRWFGTSCSQRLKRVVGLRPRLVRSLAPRQRRGRGIVWVSARAADGLSLRHWYRSCCLRRIGCFLRHTPPTGGPRLLAVPSDRVPGRSPLEAAVGGCDAWCDVEPSGTSSRCGYLVYAIPTRATEDRGACRAGTLVDGQAACSAAAATPQREGRERLNMAMDDESRMQGTGSRDDRNGCGGGSRWRRG